MIKAVIFDMDGLMFDTESLFLSCGKEALKNMGYNINEEIIMKCMGTNYNKIREIFLEELGNDFPFELFYLEYKRLKDETILNNGIRVKDGVYELLEYLRKNNYLMAIASSSSRMVINNYLELANISKNIFNVIVSGDEFKHGKPDPDIYLKTCELLEIKPYEAMVLEDSNNGVKASYLAGCFTLLIPDVVVLSEETLNMADCCLNSLTEVKKYLEKTNSY